MSWFPLNRERYAVLDYPDNGVYAFVMSRINYGGPSRQMGVLVQQGQCVLTRAIIANKTGLRSLGAVTNTLERLRLSVEPVVTAHTTGKRAMRITAPPDYLAELLGGKSTAKSTAKYTKQVEQPLVAPPVKAEPRTLPSTPTSTPPSTHVLQNKYDTTTLTYRVAKIISVEPTPGLADALRDLDGHSDGEILEAISRTYSVNPPKTSVTGWIRTIIVTVLKRASQDKHRLERQKPQPLPPPSSRQEIDAGLKQFREALDASKCEEEDQSVG